MDNTAKKVINLIDASGKPETEIEKDLGLPRSTIYDWRNGRSKSYKKYIYEISNYFNVSADYLLGNEQKNKPFVSKDDELIRDQMEKVRLLPKEIQKQVLDYIDFVIEHQDK